MHKKLAESVEWKDLLERFLPDTALMEHHEQLLKAVEINHYIFPAKLDDKKIKAIVEGFGFKLMKIQKQQNWKRAYFPIINAKAKKDALDMAYKLKNKYGDITIKHKFGEFSDADIEDEIAGVISEAIGLAEREKKKGGG